MKHPVVWLALILMLLSGGSASAQSSDSSKPVTLVQMIDPERGTFLVSVVQNGGLKILEYKVSDKTKFVTENGKAVKDGLKADAFKNPYNRPTVPVTLSFDANGGLKEVKILDKKK